MNLSFCQNRKLVTLSKRPLSVANSVSTYDSFSQFKVLSRATIEVSQDEEFVCGANLLQEVLQVAVEGLLCSSFSVQSWCVHSDDSCKLVVLVWES